MEKGFIGYYFFLLLKGKQKQTQVLLAGIIFLLSLSTLPGLIRFVSGTPILFTDFSSIGLIIYTLLNFLFVLMQKTNEDSEDAMKQEYFQTISSYKRTPEAVGEEKFH